MPTRSASVVLAASLLVAAPAPAAWEIAFRNSTTLDTSALSVGVQELSGVTYAGPSGDGKHAFLAVQDSGNRVVAFDVDLAADASIASAIAAESIPLSPGFDFEGIALSGNSETHVFVSEENNPGVREYDLATGAQVQSVTIPPVFANRRGNRGFESLTRQTNGAAYWTANEEALTVDGPASTTSAGTTVRLLKLDAASSAPAAAVQHAYEVEPIHATFLANRSGLVDLVALPDGELLAVERSFAALAFLISVFQIDATTATDISAAAFDTGLSGQSYTPVAKEPLYSGTPGGNYEGLALGPQLPNGNWALVAVADGDNSIATFELIPPAPQSPGDYTGDGVVDARDYSAWRHSYAARMPVGRGADGDGNGSVEAVDYAVWREAVAEASAVSAPEPRSLLTAGIGAVIVAFVLRPRSVAGQPAMTGLSQTPSAGGVRRAWSARGGRGKPRCSSASRHRSGHERATAERRSGRVGVHQTAGATCRAHGATRRCPSRDAGPPEPVQRRPDHRRGADAPPRR